MNIIEYAKFKKMFGGTGSAKVEATAIPVGVQVDKIYFNTNLTKEETNAYLSQLTYVQTDLLPYPICAIYGRTADGVTGIFIIVVKVSEEHYELTVIYDIVNKYSTTIYNPNSYGTDNNGWHFSGEAGGAGNSAFYGWGNVKFSYPTDGIVLTDFNGLPIGAENEKIKNVLSITPFASGTSSNKPLAYTVSSVDELPSNAVDGSIAIVNETFVLDGAGTWEFNNELPNLEQSYIAWESNGFEQPFELLFSSGGVNYRGVHIGTQGSSSWGIYSLSYDLESYSQAAYVHNPEGSYNIQGGWKLSKTIEVSYADNEAKKWLEAHATQTVKGEIFEVISSLYVRENGSWVYKCEVA